jgi:uncharacterized membrane protein YhaH (DUF805 family)
MHWFIDPVKNHYVDFEGRASRQQFWMFILLYVVFAIALAMVEVAVGLDDILTSIYGLVLFLPYLGLAVRRLHDINRSGWWILIGLVPLVGFIVLLVFYVKQGDSEANQYGPNPLGTTGDDVPQPPDGDSKQDVLPQTPSDVSQPQSENSDNQ